VGFLFLGRYKEKRCLRYFTLKDSFAEVAQSTSQKKKKNSTKGKHSRKKKNRSPLRSPRTHLRILQQRVALTPAVRKENVNSVIVLFFFSRVNSGREKKCLDAFHRKVKTMRFTWQPQKQKMAFESIH
jgi:hypothetical protein